jgi:hypothetical protein
VSGKQQKRNGSATYSTVALRPDVDGRDKPGHDGKGAVKFLHDAEVIANAGSSPYPREIRHRMHSVAQRGEQPQTVEP